MRASAKLIVLCNVVYCSIERQIKEFINSEPKSYLNLREIKNVRGKLVGFFLLRVGNCFFKITQQEYISKNFLIEGTVSCT